MSETTHKSRLSRFKHIHKQLFLSVMLLGGLLQFSNVTTLEEGQQPKTYLSSSFGDMQNAKYAQKKLNNELSVNLLQLRSLHQDFGTTQLNNSLEARTQGKINYELKTSIHLNADIGFSYSKQDIASLHALEKNNTREEKMIFGSLGFTKFFLRDLSLDSKVGLVRCDSKVSGDVDLHPTASVKVFKYFNKTQVSLGLASQALGGGSFTGVYGNQMFHHAKLGLGAALSKRLGVQGDLALGQTRDAFEGSQKANVLAMGASLDYKLYKYINLGLGIFHRKLTNEDDFQNPVREGTMVMASMTVTYF